MGQLQKASLKVCSLTLSCGIFFIIYIIFFSIFRNKGQDTGRNISGKNTDECQKCWKWSWNEELIRTIRSYCVILSQDSSVSRTWSSLRLVLVSFQNPLLFFTLFFLLPVLLIFLHCFLPLPVCLLNLFFPLPLLIPAYTSSAEVSCSFFIYHFKKSLFIYTAKCSASCEQFSKLHFLCFVLSIQLRSTWELIERSYMKVWRLQAEMKCDLYAEIFVCVKTWNMKTRKQKSFKGLIKI